MTNKTARVQLVTDDSWIKSIDDWGFANRIRTRSEAIRQLVNKGLEASGADLSGVNQKVEMVNVCREVFDVEAARQLLEKLGFPMPPQELIDPIEETEHA